MIASTPPSFIAIVGGSAAGKTWLASHLQAALGLGAMRLSLDDFYRDRSHLPVQRRCQVNFDHPRAIDWAALEQVLQDCQGGRLVRVPHYDFATHSRLSPSFRRPEWIVIVEGLWLLNRPSLRRLFHLKIFIDCPARLRWKRRLARDVAERGRSGACVRRQFCQSVAPMHARYVEPQKRWADLILTQPLSADTVSALARQIGALLGARTRREQRWLQPLGYFHHPGDENSTSPAGRDLGVQRDPKPISPF